MKLLDGRDVAGFIKQRHARQAAGLTAAPRLAIVRQGATPATDMYLKVKQRYGDDIGVAVETYTETPKTVIAKIKALNQDKDLTGLIVELPFADDPSLTEEALAAVALDKDVDGLAPKTAFEVATPKAIMWLLAAYNVALTGTVAVVGQGRLVGKPLADRLEASGVTVERCDITTKDLGDKLRQAHIIITATGQTGLITSDMVAPDAVIVDAGSPGSELSDDLLARTDITRAPNPGGVGPMTVAALFDNVLIAAQQKQK